MKYTIFSFLILTIFAFSSCDKEGFSKDKKYDKEGYKKDKDKKTCFELVYPITYTMPDGSDIFGNKEEVWTVIKEWYEANPDSEEKAALQYPVDVVFEGGETKTIDNEDEMIILKKDCKGEKCFALVYPVTFTMPDGSTVSGDEKEVWTVIKEWYVANPDSEEKPELQYPVDINFEGGGTETVEDEAEMISIKEDCDA